MAFDGVACPICGKLYSSGDAEVAYCPPTVKVGWAVSLSALRLNVGRREVFVHIGASPLKKWAKWAK
jgi:hypothetical protein